MKAIFRETEYSYTIVPITREDKRKILSNRNHHIKEYCLIFSSIAAVFTIPLFFLGLNHDNLVKYLLIILIALLLVLLLTVSVMFLHAKKGLGDKFKIVEKGIVTEQDNGGDSETMNYSYIGNNSYPSLPGNIKVGDRISIEYTLNKKNEKNLFIRAEKILPVIDDK